MPAFAYPVTDFMSSPVYTVPATASLREAQRSLEEHRTSAIAVVDTEGVLVGVVTRTDLLRVGRDKARDSRGPSLITMPETPVGNAMSRPPIHVPPDCTVSRAAGVMLDSRIHRVYVVDAKRPVGVLSTKDVMRAVIQERTSSPLSAYMSQPVVSVDVDDPVWAATDLLEKKRLSCLVVVEDGAPVGFYSQQDALAAETLQSRAPVGEAMSHSMICLPAMTYMFRAAATVLETRARRLLVTQDGNIAGILTATDFVRAAARADDTKRRRRAPAT